VLDEGSPVSPSPVTILRTPGGKARLFRQARQTAEPRAR
jgi:hypothetical protein